MSEEQQCILVTYDHAEMAEQPNVQPSGTSLQAEGRTDTSFKR